MISNGTLPDQQVVVADLGTIAARTAEAGLASPALTVVGDVVGLRASLVPQAAWSPGRRRLQERPSGPGRPSHDRGRRPGR